MVYSEDQKEAYTIQIRAVNQINNGHWYKWSRKQYNNVRKALQALSQFRVNEKLSRWWDRPNGHIPTNYEYRIIHVY